MGDDPPCPNVEGFEDIRKFFMDRPLQIGDPRNLQNPILDLLPPLPHLKDLEQIGADLHRHRGVMAVKHLPQGLCNPRNTSLHHSLHNFTSPVRSTIKVAPLRTRPEPTSTSPRKASERVPRRPAEVAEMSVFLSSSVSPNSRERSSTFAGFSKKFQ